MRIRLNGIIAVTFLVASGLEGDSLVLKRVEGEAAGRHLPYESPIRLPADGRTRKTVEFEVLDPWGRVAEEVVMATVKVTGGKIVDADMDPTREGVQVPVVKGKGSLTLQAAETVSRAILQLQAGDTFHQYPVFYVPVEEPLIVVGSVNASLGKTAMPDPRHPALSDPNDRITYFPGKTVFTGGRNAFYARGRVGEKTRLTASFDSDRYHRDRLFKDLDPDIQYPIYGDASTLVYDAQTESPFYAKLERGKSFAVLGDYHTALSSTEFAAYNRSFNGILVHNAVAEDHTVVGFGAATDREMVLDELRGLGISGYYHLRENDITLFSEKVRIEIRDRYHPETVLKSTPMVRYRDYDIDYSLGTVLFKQPVPSMDGGRNPVFIVVSYEHKNGNPRSLTGGIRYSGRFLNRFQVGSTWVVEEQSPGNYFLYGFDSKLLVTRWLTARGEIAGSRDPLSPAGSQSGKAAKADVKLIPYKDATLTGYYRTVDRTFSNRSQTARQFELGSEKYGVTGEIKRSGYGTVRSEYYRQFNRRGQPDESRISSFRVAYEKDFRGKGKVGLGYEDSKAERKIRNSTEFQTRSSRLLGGRVAYPLWPKLSATLETDINLDRDGQSKPNTASIGASYDISEEISTYLKYRFVGSEKQKSHAVLGFDSRVAENTQVVGRYEIGGAIGEDRNQASIGLRNRWQVKDDLVVNFGYENTSSVDSLEVRTPRHESMSVAVEYLPELPWKITGKYDSGKDRNSTTQMVTVASNVKVFDGLSSILKAEYFDDDFFAAAGGRIVRADYQLGLAYRPDHHDAFNSIGKIRYVSDMNSHDVPSYRYDRFIVSVLGYVQPLPLVEIGTKIARRWVLDREGSRFEDRSGATFVSVRLEVDWDLKWSSALDLRHMRLAPSGSEGENKTGVALEANYLVLKNTQVGLGYRFKRFRDPDFSGGAFDFAFHDFYVTLRAKFSEDILGLF